MIPFTSFMHVTASEYATVLVVPTESNGVELIHEGDLLVTWLVTSKSPSWMSWERYTWYAQANSMLTPDFVRVYSLTCIWLSSLTGASSAAGSTSRLGR